MVLNFIYIFILTFILNQEIDSYKYYYLQSKFTWL